MECVHANVGRETKPRIINKRHNKWTQDLSKANRIWSVFKLLTSAQQIQSAELILFATSSHDNTDKGNEMLNESFVNFSDLSLCVYYS
jgi:hypothetical protein